MTGREPVRFGSDGDLYQTLVEYEWPGTALTGQVVPLWETTSFRSPLDRLVTSSFSAKPPEWASVVRVQANELVPYPPSVQQVGVLPEAVSSEGFGSRFVTELATSTRTAVVVVALPAVSTARTAIVWV